MLACSAPIVQVAISARGRARRGRGAASTAKPCASSSAATALACVAPISSTRHRRARAARRSCGAMSAIVVEPVGAGEQRRRRLVSRRPRGGSVSSVGDIGRVAEDQVEAARRSPRPVADGRSRRASAMPSRAALRARDRQRRCRRVDADARRLRPLVERREQQRARARCRDRGCVARRRGPPKCATAASISVSLSARGISTPGPTARSIVQKSRVPVM